MKKALLVGLLLWLQAPGLAAETLIIPGSGACEFVLRDLAAAFNARNPGQEVIIPPSIGTSGGIRALLQDQCVLVRVVVLLDKKKSDPRFAYRVFGQDAVVFAVGASVEVKSLTPAQLAAIFTGKITDWREVGGPHGPIRLFIRDAADTNLGAIQFHLEEFRGIPFSPENKLVYYDYEMVQMLKKYRSGIGMLTNSSIYGDSSIKALAIDGIRPSPENIKSGNYKITATYALCFKKGQQLPELACSFIDFVFSNDAQAIIEKHGMIKVANK